MKRRGYERTRIQRGRVLQRRLSRLCPYVERWLDAKSAVNLAKRCTDAATVVSGFVVKVIITDGGDNTVFQWEHDKGVTFPPPEDRARESK